MAANPADLVVEQGVPLYKTYRFVDAVKLWPSAVGCEVRSSAVLYDGVRIDLSSYFSVPSVVTEGTGTGTDIKVTLNLTGEATRRFSSNGSYDLFLSDTGVVDAKAIVVRGSVEVITALTPAGP